MFVVSSNLSAIGYSSRFSAQKRPITVAHSARFGATVPVKTGGVMAGIAKAMDWIYREVWKELLVTDFVAMVNPRFWIALVKRGIDDARETGIREVTGMIALSPMSGWYHSAMLGLSKIFAKKKPIYFPAWVDRNAMDDFVTLFKDALHESKSPYEARQKLIERFVDGLSSTDSHVVSETLRTLSGNQLTGPEAQLPHMLGDIANSPMQQEAKARLKARFSFRDESPLGGTIPIDRSVQERLKEALSEERRRLLALPDPNMSDSLLAEKLEHYRNSMARELRIEASAQYVPESSWLDARKTDAIEAGFSDSVNLGERVRGRKRDEILDHFTNFLHQFADPVLADEQGLISKNAFHPKQKHAVLENMVGPDGLIPYAHRIKHFLIWIPFSTALTTATSFAFINNWITKRKYNGKVFFPGEGIYPEQKTDTTSLKSKASASTALQAVPQKPGQLYTSSYTVTPGFSKNSTFRNPSPQVLWPTAFNTPSFKQTPFSTPFKAQPFTSPFTSQNAIQPQFGSLGSTMMRAFDYPVARMTPLRHAQFIYAVIIVSRCVAALQRSYNEFREHATRDILGWATWFYLSHMWQRVLLGKLLPLLSKEYATVYKPLLVKEVTTLPQGTGLKASIQRLNWRLHNPLYRIEITSAEQLRDRKKQMLDHLWKKLQQQVEEKALPNTAREAIQQQTEALFKESYVPVHNLLERAWQWRQVAKFTGFAMVFAVLGIGINYLNMYLTNKNVKAGKVGLNREATATPPQPGIQYPRSYPPSFSPTSTPIPIPAPWPQPPRAAQAQWG